MDKQDVTCGELLNETEEELKIIIKSSIIDLTKEEKETLSRYVGWGGIPKEAAQ